MSALSDILTVIENPMPLHLNHLIALWRGRDHLLFHDHPVLYAKLAERALRLGEPLLACDIIREALTCADDPHFLKLHARALTQCGAHHSALEITQELLKKGEPDVEMLMLCGRLHKFVASEIPDQLQSMSYLRKSMRFYSMAYAQAKKDRARKMAGHAGINLATLALLTGDEKSALRLVKEIRASYEPIAERERPGEKDYWVQAMLAEAHLISKEFDQALKYYQKAVATAHEELHSIVSMRRQAQAILAHHNVDPGKFDFVFAIPTVASMTGLMVDHPHGETVRFPQRIVPRIRRQIVSLIIKHNIGIGFCSGASGADLIFAEEMIRRNNEVNIILPFNAERYRQTILEISGQESWALLFDQVLASASTISVLADEMGTDDQAPFLYCNEIVEGMAALRANALNANMLHIAVWDEKETADIRGTAGAVRRWLTTGQKAHVISTKTFVKAAEENEAAAAAPASELSPAPSAIVHVPEINVRNRQLLSAIMFADTVGYSRITDREIPLYVEHFIGMIPGIIHRLNLENVYRRTWGDALFMVFDTLASAAEFSLTLCDEISKVDWRRKGLPHRLNFRIALHAGPVYQMNDPVTGENNYYGYHISKGARIEPITPPGQVYTSEHFAALIAAHGITDYVCDYVGRVPHAKDFGTFPLYHLKRRSLV